MFGSPILDLAIGMAFIYLLLSLIASVVQEFLASLTQARAANLARGLHSLFSGDPLRVDEHGNPGMLFVEAVYKHGLVRGLYQDPEQDCKGVEAKALSLWKLLRMKLRHLLRLAPPARLQHENDLLLPAYIPSRTFALAMIDLLNDKTHGWDSMASIDAHLQELQRRNQVALDAAQNPIAGGAPVNVVAGYENKAVEALQALLVDAGGKVDKFQANLEDWYNDSMDRASGWYKRYVQYVLLCVGLIIAIAFNVDSIQVARTLWFDHDARQGLANAADAYVKSHHDFKSTNPLPASATASSDTFQLGDFKQGLEGTVKTFNQVSQDNMLPIGWRHSFTEYAKAFHTNPGDSSVRLLLALVGWCITAGALSLGAPFWFDMLNKIMVVRSTVKPSEKSPIEKSKA